MNDILVGWYSVGFYFLSKLLIILETAVVSRKSAHLAVILIKNKSSHR